jgi:hypothetical protein
MSTREAIIEQRTKVKGHQEKKIEKRNLRKDATIIYCRTEEQKAGRQEKDDKTMKTEERTTRGTIIEQRNRRQDHKR